MTWHNEWYKNSLKSGKTLEWTKWVSMLKNIK